MKHQITLIPGDGIGPEVTKPTLKVIKAAGVEIEWETFLTGTEALKKSGKTLPNEPMDSFNRCKVALKGPITTPVAEGFPSVNVALRKNFNHFANLRPVKNLPGIESRYKHIDLVIVRENTEGLYSGIEHEVEPVHGSAPDIAGKGIANPTAMILAATMMLRHISERKAAKAISDAPGRVLAQGECLTRDLGGRATTAQFGDAVMRELDRSGATRS